MSFCIGIDIGGTKIASAAYDAAHVELERASTPTPDGYDELLDICGAMAERLDRKCGAAATVGVGVPGAVEPKTGRVALASNVPYLLGKPLRDDLQKKLGRPVALANDATCAALSEARDGVGAGYPSVFGLILGTGVGGGWILDGRPVEGAHGLAGEIGHLPLPFREACDGPLAACACGQKGCIDKSVSGPALARLYGMTAGADAVEAERIAALAGQGDAAARATLDAYFTVVAKAMVAVIHMFDPHVIVVAGGLSGLPGLYDEVPRRWGRYAACPTLATAFLPARHGPLTGLRGAAWLGRAG